MYAWNDERETKRAMPAVLPAWPLDVLLPDVKALLRRCQDLSAPTCIGGAILLAPPRAAVTGGKDCASEPQELHAGGQRLARGPVVLPRVLLLEA